MGEHTKEPWQCVAIPHNDKRSFRYGYDWTIETVADDGPDADRICEIDSPANLPRDVVPPNGARIVACVNALAGIPDPAALRAQRDALLAACEHVVAVVELLSNERTDGLYGLYRLGAPTMRRLQAAIANAKGGA